ncbi:hypothetical protein [Trichormus azollae]
MLRTIERKGRSEYKLIIDSAEPAIERPGDYQEHKNIIQARR